MNCTTDEYHRELPSSTKKGKIQMDYAHLVQWTALVAALAAANDRLVDLFKSLCPALTQQRDVGGRALRNTPEDRKREGMLIWLSLLCGVVTAILAYFAHVLPLTNDIFQDALRVLLLGLLSSGGARLWNPVVEYLKAIKDIKKG
jgi:hypothetical protein